MHLRVLPELFVVRALDDAATHAKDLLHTLIVRSKELNTKQLLAPNSARLHPQHSSFGPMIALRPEGAVVRDLL